MIIGTTSMKGVLQEMDLVDCFNVSQSVPMIHSSSDIASILGNFKCEPSVATQIGDELESKYSTDGICMKNFLMAVELSTQKSANGSVELENISEALSAIMD